MEPQEILKRADALKADRANVEGVWDQIEKFILPLSSGGFQNKQTTEGQKSWSTIEVWDSTAVIGADRLSAAMYAGTVNNYQRWFRNAFPVTKLNQSPKARNWLDNTSEAMFNTLVASNFGLETSAAMRDAVAYGNAGVYQEVANAKKWEGIQFSAKALREILFEEDWRGRVHCWFSILEWTPSQIISKFAPEGRNTEAGKKLPEIVWKRAESGENARMEVVFCIYPAKGNEPMEYGEKERAVEKRPFHGCYVLREGAVGLGDELGYYEMPAYVIRFHRAPGTRWGYGPGTLALPTVKFLNAWMEAYMTSAEKVVDPAFLVTERGLLSDPDFGPSGQTVVRNLDDLKPFESAARFDVAQDVILTLQEMVRRYFREDDLQLKDSPAMTATEAQIREARTNRVLAGPVGRLQNDYFDPMLQTTFNMMYRAGQIEDPPDEVLAELKQSKDQDIRIEYLGPLMRSQRADDVAALERLASGVAALQKMGFQEVSDVFDAQQLVREMAEFLSVPGSVLRSVQDAQTLRAQRMQMQLAAAQAEVEKTAAEGARARAGAEEMVRGAA